MGKGKEKVTAKSKPPASEAFSIAKHIEKQAPKKLVPGRGTVRFMSKIPTYQKAGLGMTPGENTNSHYVVALPGFHDNKEWQIKAAEYLLKGDKMMRKFDNMPEDLRGFWARVYTQEQALLLW